MRETLWRLLTIFVALYAGATMFLWVASHVYVVWGKTSHAVVIHFDDLSPLDR